MKAYVQKTQRGMIGLTEPDHDSYTKLKRKIELMQPGEVMRLEWATPRNSAHHRKFFALLKLITDNSDYYDTTERALNAVKLITGHADPLIDPSTGEVLMIPKSISYDAMSQEDFEVFYENALDGIVEHILSHIDMDKANELIDRILGEWNAIEK